MKSGALTSAGNKGQVPTAHAIQVTKSSRLDTQQMLENREVGPEVYDPLSSMILYLPSKPGAPTY